MMATKQRSKTAQGTAQSIQLKGSTKIVTEFFEFGLASILYQRGLYPADDFKMVKKYGLNMLLPNEDGLQDYLRSITSQLSNWLNNSQVSRLVLAIISKDTRAVLERWQFDITLEESTCKSEPPATKGKENVTPSFVPMPSKTATTEKDGQEKEIRSQIQQMIKHICASNSFLPILEEPCTFNILAYTAKQADVPDEWRESDAKMIAGGAVEQVKLRSFSTNVHKVEAMVAYRLGDDA